MVSQTDVILHGKRFELSVAGEEVDRHIRRLADELNRDYCKAHTVPLIMVTLSGGMMFAGELSKNLRFDCEFAFVKCSSYRDGMNSSGEVNFDVEPTTSPHSRDIIIVEDIVETGNTYCALYRYLQDKGALSIRIASLVVKEDKYDKGLPIDYIGIPIEDRFVIGYGMDFNGLGRNLYGLYQLAKED